MDGFRSEFRLLGLARSLASHDALSALERLGIAPRTVRLVEFVRGSRGDDRSASAVARALSEAGPGFAALGRLVGLFWEPLELGALGAGDDAWPRPPPFAADEARATIARELHQPFKSLFSAFDDAPDTIGPLAQVHRAESTDGRALAVKVLRPGVDAALMRDLALMGALAGRLALLRPEWRGLRIEDSIDGFAEVLETGIDLRLEAAAAMKIADNFVGDETFRLAETDWERSARRVLTRAYVTGPGIDERDAIMAAGFDPAQVLVNLITAFFKQVLRDGAFVTEFSGETLRMAQDGAIVATDLGAVVRLTPGARRYLGALLAGLVERDFEGAARALQEAGWVPPPSRAGLDRARARADCRHRGRRKAVVLRPRRPRLSRRRAGDPRGAPKADRIRIGAAWDRADRGGDCAANTSLGYGLAGDPKLPGRRPRAPRPANRATASRRLRARGGPTSGRVPGASSRGCAASLSQGDPEATLRHRDKPVSADDVDRIRGVLCLPGADPLIAAPPQGTMRPDRGRSVSLNGDPPGT
ncbi:MAG: AarF/UbiB family protein [Rhodospirillales bacterium]|nr:AarF/UbiB family protein [Rhodospirillales bacterium]